jgi:hypothetical protein
LDVVATSGAEPFELSGAADALRNHPHVKRVGEEDDGSDEASVGLGRT